MKLFIFALFLAATPAFAADPLLDLRNKDGMGLLTKDLTVYDDGSVMCSKIVNSSGQMSDPVQITSLSDDDISRVKTSIAAITSAPLVRLHPDQGFNPGGFTATYILVRADGTSLTFAKNVSGVDYGFANLRGQDLVAMLQKLAQLGCGR